ncbi:MAG: response regulator [Oscillospiraceae bacterium]
MQILNVMLVDDEPNVRQGIKMMIPWDELGLNVIGEGEDGDDGLDKMMSLHPDIVIADVKMPGKSGIEMTEEAIAKGFSGKVIILSGYSDFSNAKNAISLGVENYILKPVDEDELIECLKNVREKILKERELDFRLAKGCEYINEQLTKGLLSGDPKAIEEARSSGYTFSSYATAIISCTDKDSPEHRSTVISNVNKFFNNCGNVDIVSMDLSGMQAIVFKGWKHSGIMEMLYRLNKSFSGIIFIAVGNTVSSPADICNSYKSAYKLYSCRFLYMHYGVVTEDVMNRSPEEIMSMPEITSQIFAFMEINDTVKLEKTLDILMDNLRCKKFPPERIKVICITLVMDIRSKIVKSSAEKKQDDILGEKLISEIGEQNSLFDIIRLLKSTFTEVSNICFGRTTKSTMERVVQYIKSNYNQELRLEMLAQIFGYNSAYLGKVFHQYTGENFNNYLDSIRITEAKRLLSMDEYKVYEVAEMVGYSNINYFHNKFKKSVGVSPLTYKKSFRMNSADPAKPSDDEDEEE